ncbi:uncharacterized protein LOC101238128 [Hydra vulgaris]|uniref:uncharacterized protein LOC101238128 n=1 Tax=Hydra vulgaris TaxID=6087 RepID=UPI001F5ED9BD|nr:uncharacterized protein LOC101238128 [Hydra vulgaris]
MRELFEKTVGPYWDSHVSKYLQNNHISLDVVSVIEKMLLGDLVNKMPRYDLQDFWNVPVKALLYQSSFYLKETGIEDVIIMLKSVYFENQKSVTFEFQGINISQPYILYIYPYVKNVVIKLQFNQTLRIMKAFEITLSQLAVLSFDSFDKINEIMANEVFCKLHKQGSSYYHKEILNILVRIQMYRSSFYQWSLLCNQNSLIHSQEVINYISNRCFKQDFSNVGLILYNLSAEYANVFKLLTVEESSILVNRTLLNSNLIPVQNQLAEMIKVMKIVNTAKSRCIIFLLNDIGLSLNSIIYLTISNILTRVHDLPWSILVKLYEIEEYVAVKANFIIFRDLPKLISGENKIQTIDLKFLQLQTIQLILNALSVKINATALSNQYKDISILMSKFPLTRFAAVFDLSHEYVINSTLTSLTYASFNLNYNDFLENYGVTPSQYSFFDRTTIKDMGLLLKLEKKDLIFLAINQLIASMKSNIIFFNIMLMTPVKLASSNNKTVNFQLSIPQIVHEIGNGVVKTLDEFLNFIKRWSTSESAIIILTEKDLNDLGMLLMRPTTEVANMRIVDVVNAILDTFGDHCDPQNLYCKKLQVCTKMSENGSRCQCQLGYRFSGPSECSDLNECLYTNVTCHKNAYCKNTEGSYHCLCKIGYNGDGRFCNNVNECSIGTYNCSNNTFCMDTEGSYKCICNKGFIENQFGQCIEIDKCALETYNCHVNGLCIKTSNNYTCQCRNGFTGDGTTSCLDVNECETKSYNCTANSHCLNTIGSYLCICNEGYFNDNKFCHQCSDTRFTCHKYAECYKQIYNNFYCVCKIGFIGNGTFCQDIDECKNENICGMGQCKNLIGSYSCLCYQGYRLNFDNKRCIDIDECKESLNLGIFLCNKSQQQCLNKEGSYACITNSFNKYATVGLSITIPLLIVFGILFFGSYVQRRKIKAKKELTNFDRKLQELYVNRKSDSERLKSIQKL